LKKFNLEIMKYASQKNNSEKNFYSKIVNSNITEAISRKSINHQDSVHLYNKIDELYDTITPMKNIIQNFDLYESVIWKYFNTLFPIITVLNITNEDNMPFVSTDAVGIIVETKKDIYLLNIPFNKWHKLILSNNKIIYTTTLEIVIHSLQKFIKKDILSITPFKIIRKEIEIESQTNNILETVKESIKKRRVAKEIAIQVFTKYSNTNSKIFKKIKDWKRLNLFKMNYDYSLGYSDKVLGDKLTLGYETTKSEVSEEKDIFKYLLEQKEILIHRPYQKFITPKVIEQAANDPNVISIKQSLYRVSKDSKIIKALIKAAKNGKDVFLVIEPRARFDEENNIKVIETLRKYGVSVIPGIIKYKTHAKLLQITSIKKGKISILTNISTGNFNENTAKTYEDFDLFTNCNLVGQEVAKLFARIAGMNISFQENYIISSPNSQNKIINLINNSSKKIVIKVNHIGDKEIILALENAKKRGVEVILIVRTTNDMGDGIMVVGDYLEHSRIFVFDDIIYLGSSDLLYRNTRRRFEVIVEVKEEINKNRIKDLLAIYQNNKKFDIQKRVSDYYLQKIK